MINKGYLTADKSSKGDEMLTPLYAVKPLIKYLKKDAIIWCPFDTELSAYVQGLRAAGHRVICSHIINGQDFFEYEPDEKYDIIISNPPFSKKDSVLERLAEIGKPFAILLPIPTLQGQKRFDYIKDCQALIFDKRINYYKDDARTEIDKGVSFGSFYLCKNFLPKDLIFEKLDI